MSYAKKKETKREVAYGLKVTGDVRVFAKERIVKVQGKDTQIIDSWFNVSLKTGDESWDNKSMKIIFNRDKGVPENNTEIVINDSWFMLHGQGQYQQIVLYVKDWDFK